MFNENEMPDMKNAEMVNTDTVQASEAQQLSVEQAVPVESAQERNYRALREKAQRMERERDELMRRLQETEQRSAMPGPANEPEEDEPAPTDLVEWRHVKKKISRLEEQLKNTQQQSTVMTVEARLKTQYPDFDAVVSAENIEALRSAHPEIAHTLNASPDLYNKAVSAYTLIKKLGIHHEDLHHAERALAQKNTSKPRPLTSIAPQQGDTPLSRANAFANGLTDDLKSQLHKEMLDAMKNR